MAIEKVNMKIKFINPSNQHPIAFNNHRGSLIVLNPGFSETVDFGNTKHPQKTLDYYKTFKGRLEVLWMDKPKVEELLKSNEKATLEPEKHEDEEELLDEEDSEEELQDSSTKFTREELESMRYQKLIKLAKQNGIESKKKEEIINELLGE